MSKSHMTIMVSLCKSFVYADFHIVSISSKYRSGWNNRRKQNRDTTMKTEQSRQRKKSQRHIAQLIWGQVNHLNFYFAEIRINRFLSSYCFQLGSGIYFSLRSIQIFISVQRTIKIAFMLSNHSLFMACCVWVFCAHSINGIDHIFFNLNYFFIRCNYSLAAWSVFVHLPILSTQEIKFFFSCTDVGLPINYNKQILMHGQWTPTGYIFTHLHIYASSA